jgi:hypothetical protein
MYKRLYAGAIQCGCGQGGGGPGLRASGVLFVKREFLFIMAKLATV